MLLGGSMVPRCVLQLLLGEKNHKISNNSVTIKAREKISTDSEFLEHF
jgi:hypothetical protein